MRDYFDVFGLPRRLAVDGDELRRRFYDLSRRHHPDFHQLASESEQAEALAQSALVNRAYRALREPLARVEYLIALEEGRDTAEGATAKPRAPMDLLEEMMELQESLEEARSSGLDRAARARLGEERQRLLARREQTDRQIEARCAEWDAAVEEGGDRAGLLRWFKEALAARAYLTTVIDDLSEALGEERETHAAHRGH